jgi:hypothetical protein
MHHLQAAVIQTDAARHVAGFADRQQFFGPFAREIEVHDLERVGFIRRDDLVWSASAPGDVTVYCHFKGGNRVGLNLVQFRARAAVDRRIGQMKQDIDDPRRLMSQQVGKRFRELRADALQTRQRRKQGIEDRGTHAAGRWRMGAEVATTLRTLTIGRRTAI